MPKWKILLFLLLLGGQGYAQLTKAVDYAVIYDFSYIRDTATNEYHRGYKCLTLRAGDEGRFQDLNEHFNDSILISFGERYPGLNTGSLPPRKMKKVLEALDATMLKWQKPSSDKYRITKDFAAGTSKLVSVYGINPQHLEQALAQDWQLVAGRDTIADMVCYKATTRYGGRNYVAWYTPSIPVSDGPYVFAGLPGLILKVSDEEDWYSFTINSINLSPHDRFWNAYFILSASVPVDRPAFVRTMQRKKDNPTLPDNVIDEPEEIKLRIKENNRKRFDLLLERVD